MSKQEKHERIRQALASLGYHVRSTKGYPLTIVSKQAIGQAA